MGCKYYLIINKSTCIPASLLMLSYFYIQNSVLLLGLIYCSSISNND